METMGGAYEWTELRKIRYDNVDSVTDSETPFVAYNAIMGFWYRAAISMGSDAPDHYPDMTITHLCRPVRSTFAVRETVSLGIMGAPRVPPLNPSESIVL